MAGFACGLVVEARDPHSIWGPYVRPLSAASSNVLLSGTQIPDEFTPLPWGRARLLFFLGYPVFQFKRHNYKHELGAQGAQYGLIQEDGIKCRDP